MLFLDNQPVPGDRDRRYRSPFEWLLFRYERLCCELDKVGDELSRELARGKGSKLKSQLEYRLGVQAAGIYRQLRRLLELMDATDPDRQQSRPRLIGSATWLRAQYAKAKAIEPVATPSPNYYRIEGL